MTTARPENLQSMTTVGLVGAGHMGSALGAALRAGGHRVVTTLAGRSARTARLVAENGIAVVTDLSELVGTADVVLVVTPPAAAVDAAASVATAARTTASHPLVADLNAVAPSTMDYIAATLGSAGLGLVD